MPVAWHLSQRSNCYQKKLFSLVAAAEMLLPKIQRGNPSSETVLSSDPMEVLDWTQEDTCRNLDQKKVDQKKDQKKVDNPSMGCCSAKMNARWTVSGLRENRGFQVQQVV